MSAFGREIANEFRKNRIYFFIAFASLILLYGLNLVLDKDIVVAINWEDGLFENLTALAFFLTSLAFLILFIRTRKVIHILFFLLFLFGTGEEISWGERIFHFEVPESIAAINAQNEFNIHNLKVLSSFDENGIKPGLSRYMTVSAFYLLFCFFYGILLPVFFIRISFIRKLVNRIHLPIPPLVLGIFFLINYLIFKSLSHVDVMGDPSVHFHSVIDESFELGSALIFLLISSAFLQTVIVPQRKITPLTKESNIEGVMS